MHWIPSAMSALGRGYESTVSVKKKLYMNVAPGRESTVYNEADQPNGLEFEVESLRISREK